MINKLAAEAYENMMLSTGMTKQAFLFFLPLVGSTVERKESLAGLRGEEAQKFWEDRDANINRTLGGAAIGTAAGIGGGNLLGRIGGLPEPDPRKMHIDESLAKLKNTTTRGRFGREFFDSAGYAKDVNRARKKLVDEALSSRKLSRMAGGGALGLVAGTLGSHLYNSMRREE